MSVSNLQTATERFLSEKGIPSLLLSRRDDDPVDLVALIRELADGKPDNESASGENLAHSDHCHISRIDLGIRTKKVQRLEP